jgi:NAD+ synthase
MTDRLVLALAQIDPTVGDVAGNCDLARRFRKQAADEGADLVVLGELAVSGYPPEDLVLKPAFLDQVTEAVQALAKETGDGGPALLLGAPWRDEGALRNAALLLDAGVIAGVSHKHQLPSYGVFDEDRIFSPGRMPGPISFRGVPLGVMVCEDMWTGDVTECLEESGAEILITINGSPYEIDKHDQRLNLGVARVGESGLPLAYVNLVGGQDELVFDGASFVLGADRALCAQAAPWAEELLATRWRRDTKGWICEGGTLAPQAETADDSVESVYRAMVLGLRDYVVKNRFPGVVMGLSGGIDSALTAAVAVDALGADKVHCVMMPSPYTSDESLEDAAACAGLLGIRYDTIGIEPAMEAFQNMLADAFAGRQADETEENIQARARGMIVMALSNKLGFMPLTTGNKSEMSVGYATLYGDMCGGFSVLKDVYKTTVFAAARWRNAHRPPDALGPEGPAVPERIITKRPSAELKPDQFDDDSLPPYDALDDILKSLIEGEHAVADVVARGHDAALVRRVWRMLDRAEYKRRQAPPGVKISSRAFGRDRRYPITNGFTDQA